MDVLDAIRTRRSIGRLEGDVADDDLREFIAAAICAPNHKRTEPWFFTVVRGEARARLGEAWAAAAAAQSALSDEERAAFLRREANKPLRAPVLVVVSTRTDPDPIVALEDYAATCAAVQNFLLAAWARGYGAIWRTGEMAYAAAVKAQLELAAHDRIVAIIYLGRPAMAVPKAPAHDLAAVVRTLG
jgi:nitroreductase